MPRHATSLGAGNFAPASKLLQRYEQEKAYKMHQQKMSNMRHRLDVERPKKYNHLLLRLKQVQKDEERQAQIDYENKLLLTKMTGIMKYGGGLDNYNNYEIRSLNYPHRNKVNEEILRENIGIAKRLESVKPQLRVDRWEKEYQQHSYLKRLWSDSVKDFGEYTPRRMSRMSKAVKRSMDDSLDEIEDYESEATGDDKKKLPKLGGRRLRATQSEADGPISSRKAGPQGGTKFPKIVPHKHLVEHDFSMYYSKDYNPETERIKSVRKSYEENKKENKKNPVDSKSSDGKEDNSPKDKGTKHASKSEEESPYSNTAKHKNAKKEKSESDNKKDDKKSDNGKRKGKEETKKGLEPKGSKLETKSLTSVQSVNVAGNDMERVKTLISEENDKEASVSEKSSEADDDETNQNITNEDLKENTDNQNDDIKHENKASSVKKTESTVKDKKQNDSSDRNDQSPGTKSANPRDSEKVDSAKEKEESSEMECSNDPQKVHIEENTNKQKNTDSSLSDTNESHSDSVPDKDYQNNDEQAQQTQQSETDKDINTGDNKSGNGEISKKTSETGSSKKQDNKQNVKGREKKNKEDGTSGATGKEDTTDVAQLFKIAKQLGRPEDIFIKTLIKKTHKQRMATKAKFRQKYDLDLMSELKTGLGLQWELLIKELLEDRGFADAMAVFDAMCDLEGKKTLDVSDVVLVLCTRNNAAMAELKESYRKEFSISLEEDIMDRTKEAVQTLLLALQKGERDESADPDLVQCHDDAKALYESGDGRWTSENGLFLKMVTEKSPAHMQCVLNEFKTVSGGQDIVDVMKSDCPKDFFLSVKTYVNCIRSPATFFADQLHANKLPSNPVFVATLVARSEIDAPAVRKAYKKKYHIDLVEDIKNFSYPTTKCLMELASKVPPAKKDNQVKKTYTKPQHTQQPQQSPAQPQTKKGAAPSTQKEKEQVKKVPSQPQQFTKSKVDSVDNQAAKGAAKSKETVKNNGTVKPASNFNAEDDCDKLYQAVSSDSGADEAAVVAILPKRSNKQRQEIKKFYEQKYKKNLIIDLESELEGDMEEIVFALLMTPTEYDAYCVHKAVEEMGTSEATLIGILCTRPSKELKAIKDYYKKAYKSDMDQDISGDCRGDFGDLVMALCKTERDPGSEVNKQQAQNDAKDLYKDGSLDLKGELFKTLLTKKSHAQVAATFLEYEKLAGHDIYSAIAKVMNDEDEGYVGVAKAVGDPVLFYTEAISSCFTSTGVNDNMLIRCVVPRSEIDLLDVKAKHVELYSKGLWDTVNREVKDSYKNLLLAIINK